REQGGVHHRLRNLPPHGMADSLRSTALGILARGDRAGHDARMPTLPDIHPVTDVPAAPAAEALAHFSRLLAFETDCWDVRHALQNGHEGFTLLDVRSPDAFAAGHVDGATNLPHGRINERNLAACPADTVFVVYCAGPHCHVADC